MVAMRLGYHNERANVLDTTFIDELASKAPTPGGGGAAAACGALASALASMVGNLTVGKKRYAHVEGEVNASLARLADLRARLIELVEADARAFSPLAGAYGMPKDTPEQAAAKEAALQDALVGACEVPLDIMRACAQVVDECDFMAKCGSRLAVSDAGVAVAFAKAALLGASLNVFINVGSMTDEKRARQYREEADALIASVAAKADAVYSFVLDEIGA